MAIAPNGRDQEMINGIDHIIPQPSSHAALFSNGGEANESIHFNFSSALPPSSTHHLTLDRVRAILQHKPTNNNNALHDPNQAEERMRKILSERSRRQYNTLLVAAAQDTVAKVLKEKDAQVRRLARQLSQMRTEMLTWQSKARSLQAKLEVAKKGMEEGSGETSLSEDDAGSAAAAYVDYEERKRVRILRSKLAQGVCRECEERPATVVVLPCRHLCLCADCNEEVAPVQCHVCSCIRTGCFQVFLD